MLFLTINLWGQGQDGSVSLSIHKELKCGADRLEVLLPLIKDKKVGVVGNQTSMVGKTHLVDTLLASHVKVVRVFSPEHGFRGDADAGEHVISGVDKQTGLTVVSLYGDNKKPTEKQVKDLDVLVFDIQDVGVRFYTYISTLHYVMEAAAENGVEVIVLDRPNPNGHYVDGPVLEPAYTSFVGMHPVPVVYGMTIGEYATMINGEHWLKEGVTCKLEVINLEGYMHAMSYTLPVAPSPNLRSDMAINLYPSLCFFEGTSVSVGRGTKHPFEIYGHPDFDHSGYSFKPVSGPGSKHPKLEGKVCYGVDLTENYKRGDRLNLEYLLYARDQFGNKEWISESRFFNLLAGNGSLQEQLKTGKSEQEIRDSWKEGLDAFLITRRKYLRYP